MTFKFESVSAFAKEMKDRGMNGIVEGFSGGRGWTGEEFLESREKAAKGDTSHVAEAERLLDKLNLSIETISPQWVPSVAGMIPSVPDYLAGHPECMRTITDCQSEAAPMRIFVCTSSSAGVNWKDLQKRGIAVLAATMALCQSRPVELWTCTAMDGSDGTTNVMCRINSSPLRLSEACYALCSIGFDRNLTHTFGARANGFTGDWSSYGHTESGLRRMLDTDPNDLVIPPSFLTDDLIIKNPIAWVKQVLSRFQNREEF